MKQPWSSENFAYRKKKRRTIFPFDWISYNVWIYENRYQRLKYHLTFFFFRFGLNVNWGSLNWAFWTSLSCMGTLFTFSRILSLVLLILGLKVNPWHSLFYFSSTFCIRSFSILFCQLFMFSKNLFTSRVVYGALLWEWNSSKNS